MITRQAPAKVNLALHVLGQRDDGYHLLDSIVVFADIADRLTFAPATGLDLIVTGPFAEGVPQDGRNLVCKAAALFGADLGARITLDKHLPHAAGIGGGSSDAAAALGGLAALWGRALPDAGAILSLGADVPVCLSHRPQRLQGVGDIVTPLPALPKLWIVLVNPRAAVPTASVFAGLARKDNPPLEPWHAGADFLDWLARQRNDLAAPARAIAPQIEQALAALTQSGARIARMSGSGATCFGLFTEEEAAQQARADIAKAHPAWWVQAGAVLG